MKGIYKITFFLLAVLLLAACSRKKSTFLSRSKHSVTAKYNILYNGNIAFEKGLEEVSRSYRDDFWEILPIERFDSDDKKGLPGESKNPNFNIAEEKAVKAVQKHSIYIGGEEFNPQIDEAYILLGKSRYFDNRFVQALDAFNFILKTYPTCNTINQAKVWKAKTNIRLNNEEVAIENIKKMFKLEEIDDEDYADASAMIAQAYINLDSIEAALPYIKRASETVKNHELEGRYLYITGQLYDKLEKIDSANLTFDKVIALKRTSPRVYMINAYIEKARNFDFTKEDRVAFLELLYNLEQDRENRPFLDKIYNQIGEYYRKNDSIDLAIEFYNRSLDAYADDRKMQAVNYKTLAEIYFDFAEYKLTGAYYDSTLTNLDENTRPWRRIKKKRDNLDGVIKYEDIAYRNDSILGLIAMTESERLSYFTNYTVNLKLKAVEDSLARIAQEEQIENQEFFNSKENKTGGPNAGATFYFYTSTTISFGKQEFRKRWGNRKLEDNWRLSDKLSKLDDVEESDVTARIEESDLYKPETYIALIPSEPTVIDSIIKDRNFAYFQLGGLYKEKFKEYDLSINKFETLLSFNPEERLVLPCLYNLYKINQVLEEETKAEAYKNEILTRYPDSRYTEILKNPNAILATDESSPEFIYKELYGEFKKSNYQHVIESCDKFIISYFGNPIIPKYELLKADAIGRQQGFEPFKKAINYIALTYPNTPEGKKAQDLYSNLMPQLANKEFYSDTISNRWKIAYTFPTTERENAEKLKEKLDKAIASYNYSEMSTSIDYYVNDTIFVMIHGLSSRLGGKGFAEILSENKKYKIKASSYEISSLNYRIIQIHKNLEEYLITDFSDGKGKQKSNKTQKQKARDKKEARDNNSSSKSRNVNKKDSRKNLPGKKG